MIEFLIKLHPEIAIKSKSVRKRQTLLLERNLKTILLQVDSRVAVSNNFDHLTVRCDSDDEALRQRLIERLQCIPGIVAFAEMQSSRFSSLHDIFEQVLAVYAAQLAHKSFSVRVRRSGNHDFTSIEAERYIGGGLNQHVASARSIFWNRQGVCSKYRGIVHRLNGDDEVGCVRLAVGALTCVGDGRDRA